MYNNLLNAGVDHLLAQHVAHLLIRDPLVIYDDRIDIDDAKYSDHFENFQSTNWQNVRFKPPPPKQNTIGWRVEFRTMEIAFTEFENAAHACFVSLILRAIRLYNLDFYLPLSKVDENMTIGHKRNAINFHKFWFKHSIYDDGNKHYSQMTLNEIFNGQQGENPCEPLLPPFVGLVPIVRKMLNDEAAMMTKETFNKLNKYLDYIGLKAAGKVMTNATWIRNFVAHHPAYKFDSIVTPEITYDLLKKVSRISSGKEKAPELYADLL